MMFLQRASNGEGLAQRAAALHLLYLHLRDGGKSPALRRRHLRREIFRAESERRALRLKGEGSVAARQERGLVPAYGQTS